MIQRAGPGPNALNGGDKTASCSWATVEVGSGQNSKTCFSQKRFLVPGQSAAGLVLNDAGLKEVSFFLQVDHFAHPREGVFFVGEHGF